MKSNWTSILTKIDLQWILVIRFFHHKKRSAIFLHSFSRTYLHTVNPQPAIMFRSLSVSYKILGLFVLESQGNNNLIITESITTDIRRYATFHDSV